MFNVSMSLPTALLVSCVLAGTAASVSAQTAPTPITHQKVTYVTGGIGEDEVHAFRQVASQYNMRITLASKSGQYLSDVDVSITSGRDVVLAVRTEGPFLFVRVPAGRYRIAARDRHLTETKEITVPSRGAVDVHFYWEDPDRHGVIQLCRRCPNARSR
ncbi:MAG: carboxypeptidase regulatory-like domain-containing protein [Trinickia sp.]